MLAARLSLGCWLARGSGHSSWIDASHHVNYYAIILWTLMPSSCGLYIIMIIK